MIKTSFKRVTWPRQAAAHVIVNKEISSDWISQKTVSKLEEMLKIDFVLVFLHH